MAGTTKAQSGGHLGTIALATLVAGLGYGVWTLSSYTPDTQPIAAPVSASAKPVVPVDDGASLLGAPRALAEYQNTTKRPLFFADRRPVDRTPAKVADTVVKPPPTPPTPLEQFQLLGIEKRLNSRPRVLIRTSAEGQGVWFQVGDVVRGWKVAEISDQNAVFLANGLRGELRLFAVRTGKPR